MYRAMGDFHIDGMAMRYSEFAPRLYNLCLSLGLAAGHIIPSRAFCSDENQGYPVIVMTQHFGTFPFNHGQVGGVVATDRHGPHAAHGQDLLIVQASHVGFEPDSGRFGLYRRGLTRENQFGDCCGKICDVLEWYQHEYHHAAQNIRLSREQGRPSMVIDNHLLNESRAEGLFLSFDRLIEGSLADPLRVFSTAKAYAPAPQLLERLGPDVWDEYGPPIGDRLTRDLFSFRRPHTPGTEGQDQLEMNLSPMMPAICTSVHPTLDAARFNTQVEFDRTYRSIQRSRAYEGRNLLFIAGLNIDVSPREGMLFPLTKFVPWAAYVRRATGSSYLLEQSALVAALRAESSINPRQISFDEAISAMSSTEEVKLPPVG